MRCVQFFAIVIDDSGQSGLVRYEPGCCAQDFFFGSKQRHRNEVVWRPQENSAPPWRLGSKFFSHGNGANSSRNL